MAFESLLQSKTVAETWAAFKKQRVELLYVMDQIRQSLAVLQASAEFASATEAEQTLLDGMQVVVTTPIPDDIT